MFFNFNNGHAGPFPFKHPSENATQQNVEQNVDGEPKWMETPEGLIINDPSLVTLIKTDSDPMTQEELSRVFIIQPSGPGFTFVFN